MLLVGVFTLVYVLQSGPYGKFSDLIGKLHQTCYFPDANKSQFLNQNVYSYHSGKGIFYLFPEIV